jgi:hypothetical protein
MWHWLGVWADCRSPAGLRTSFNDQRNHSPLNRGLTMRAQVGAGRTRLYTTGFADFDRAAVERAA